MQTAPQSPTTSAPSLTPQPTGLTSLGAHLIPVVLGLLALMLAFPRPGWGALAHIALAPLIVVAVKSARPRFMTLILYTCLSIWWLWMIRWLAQVTVGGYIGLSMVMALYCTAALLSTRVFYRRTGHLLVLTFPICWVAWEFLRGYWPSGGFGWLALSHSQAPWLPDQGPSYLLQCADIFGEYTVSFLVAMTSGLIADLLLQPIFIVRPGSKPKPNRWVQASLLCWFLAFCAAMSYGYWRINSTPAHTAQSGLNVAVIQTNEPVNNKDLKSAKDIYASWLEMVALTRAATKDPLTPDLIAWPESAVPANLNPESIEFYESFQRGSFIERLEYVQATLALAKSIDTPILAGAPAVMRWELLDVGEGKVRPIPHDRYNSAFLISPKGAILPDYYSKMHRVPFGEYIPWVDSSPWLKGLFIKHLAPWGYDFTIRPGPRPIVFQIPAKGSPDPHIYRVVTPICFEDSVARATHQLIWAPGGNKQADAIVNMTNDGWYPDTDQCLQHFQVAVVRSVENRVPSARAVNTGMSGFIDSAGRITQIVQKDDKIQSISGFGVSQLKPDDRTTLWGVVGITPALILFFLVLAGLVVNWALKTLVYYKLRQAAKALKQASMENPGTKSADVGNSSQHP
jgi:apolipoprotein N-acyltransferase